MPLTGEMLNKQGNASCKEEAPNISPKYLSLGKTAAEVTPEETTAPARKIKKTAHGLVTKNLVVLTELNGKTGLGESAGGLVVGFAYWVHEVSSSEFALAYTKAQCESATEAEWIEWTVTIKATTKFAKVEELVVTARVEAKWKAAANIQNELEAAVTVESNANSQEVKWLLGYSAVSAGTLCLVEKAEEPFRTLQKGDKYEVPTSGSKVSQTGFVI